MACRRASRPARSARKSKSARLGTRSSCTRGRGGMAGSLAHSDRPAAVRRLLDALADTLRAAAASEASAAAPLDDFARRVRALGTAALGVLLPGPGAYYPLPTHPAVEVYVTLTPEGEWWRDDGPWRREPPGAAIYHAPGVPHAMRAGSAPLLALYVWRGDLATYARITSPSSPTRRSSPGRAGARPGGRRARGT